MLDFQYYIYRTLNYEEITAQNRNKFEVSICERVETINSFSLTYEEKKR